MKQATIHTQQKPESFELDEELLHRAKDGDDEAFRDLIKPLEERLYRQALHMCGCPQSSCDLLQETLIVAWKTLSKYDTSCRITTWLYSIMLRKHWNYSRSAWIRKIRFFGIGDSEQHCLIEGQTHTLNPIQAPDALKIKSEQYEKLHALVNLLPIKLREVIALRFFSEASLEEISILLKCPLGTVKSRLFNGLEKLRGMNVANLK